LTQLSFTHSESSIILSGAPVTMRLALRGELILCLRIGERGDRAWPSYLAERGPRAQEGGVVLSADVAECGEFLVRLDREGGDLEFRRRDGQPTFRLLLARVETSPRVRLCLKLAGEQHLYGLGHGGQPFDRLGATRRLWNCHVNHGSGSDIALPLIVSTAGFALFFDDPNAGTIFPGDLPDEVWIEFASAGALDLYCIGGGDLRAVLKGVADLLGHAPMPPRWALGFMQSSRHFTGPDEVAGLARTIREKALPCDGLIFLSTYGDGKGWNRAVGRLEFDPATFPDPARMLARFAADNFRVVTHEYPVLHPQSPLFAEAATKGYLLDDGYPDVAPTARPSVSFHEGQRYLDFARDEVRAWWWEQHRDLLDLGVAGWWLDGGEGPLPETRSPTDAIGLHNRFDLFRQQAFAEGEARDRPEVRPFLLCRSGGPGMQRFGAGCWSGDINRTFPTLEAQIGLGLNMGLSGVPYWGTDTGGFYPSTPADGELFARWFQFAAFTPIFRAHGWTWREHLPWAYGPEIEAICRKYLELRYRLMPYTYTLPYAAHRAGLPLMRPLVLDYPDDANSWECASEYFWGDAILVAPVTRAGAERWPVYLPKGVWYDFWTGEAYQGGRGVSVAAPLDRLPLFIRAGAILPMGPLVQHLSGYRPEQLTLLVYPEQRSTFTLYEDDGETNAYRHGHFATTTIECLKSDAEVVCRIGAPEGDTTLVPAGRSYQLQVRASTRPRAVKDGSSRELGWHYDGHFVSLEVAHHPAEVTVEMPSA